MSPISSKISPAESSASAAESALPSPFRTSASANQHQPTHGPRATQWLRDYNEALAPYSEPGGYINFMQDDDYGTAGFVTTTARTTTGSCR